MRTKRRNIVIGLLAFFTSACNPDITNINNNTNVNNSGGSPKNVSVDSVVMTPTTATLNFGLCSNTSQQFAVTVYPANATDQTFTFTLTKNGAATLNGFGLATGVRAGVDTVTSRSNSDSSKIARSVITVTSCIPPVTKVAVTGISISPATISINLGNCSGNSVQVSATVSPSNATSQGFSLVVTNHGSVTMSETGVLTAVKTGVGLDSAEVISLDNPTMKSWAPITVTPCPSPTSVDTTITLSPAGGSGIKGSTGQVTGIVTGPVGMDKTVLYYSTGLNTVYVSQSGGTAVIGSTTFTNVLAGFLYFGTPGTVQICGQLKVAPLIKDCKPWTSH